MPIISAFVVLVLAASQPAAPRAMIDVYPELRPLVEVVSHSSDVTLLSLNPSIRINENNRAECVGWCLYSWEVYGAAHVVLSEDLEILRKDLLASLSAKEDAPVMMCFNPRHSARLSSGGRIYDFVACFECGKVYVYKDQSVLVYGIPLSGSSQSWNSILAKTGVQLAPDHP